MKRTTNPSATHRRIARSVSLVLLGSGVLAACSPPPPDDSSTGTTVPTTAPATTAAPTTTPASTTTATPNVSTAIGGSYAVRYGTASTATIHVSAGTVTVSAGPGFRIAGATCDLPTDTVLAVLSGSGTTYGGSHSNFSATTCEYVGASGSTLVLNSDGSVSLTSSTGSHLFTKTADAPALSPDLAASFDVTYGTTGSVAGHVSGNNVSLSVTSPFKFTKASCALPARTALGAYSGAGLQRGGTYSTFDATTCLYRGAAGSTLYINSDRSLTVTTDTGPRLYTWRSSIATTTPTVAGDFKVRYASDGVATVRQSATTYTVSVSSAFTVEGSSCALPAGTVIGSYSGSGIQFGGTHSNFNTTTCIYAGATGSTMWVNNDRSLTVTSSTGLHFFERI